MSVSEVRWALSVLDHRHHALTDDDRDGVVVARCGHHMPSPLHIDTSSAANGSLCSLCAALVVPKPPDPPGLSAL